MSIPTLEVIRENLKNVLQQQQVYDVTFEEFTECSNGVEMVKLCYGLMSSYGVFPKFKTDESKSAALSEKNRIEGNHAFAKRNDILAIRKYSISACYAPVNGKEFALAIANRSAVTSSLDEHKHCISDVDLALFGNYPENLRFKLLMRKGKSLFQLGELKKAEDVLTKALSNLVISGLTGEKLVKEESKIKELLKQCASNSDEIPVSACESGFRVPDLSYGCSTNIESASSAIDIVYSEELGRCLYAVCDINPGDVLAVENPYVSCLVPESYGLYCYKCLKRSYSLIPCPNCPLACYCSSECLKQSFKEDHAVECPSLSSLIALGCNKMELLSVRVLIKAARGNLSNLINVVQEAESTKTTPLMNGRDGEMYKSDTYTAVHFLEGNTSLRCSLDMFRRALDAAILLYTLHVTSPAFAQENEELWFAGGLLLKYLQSVPSNAHEVSEIVVKADGSIENVEVGGGLYSLLSLTNHSCDPNVVRHNYDGVTISLTAIQSISKGEQIFDNYGYHYAVHLLDHRQRCLKAQYYFICGCIACQEDWPLYAGMPTTNPTYLPGGAELSELAKLKEEFKKILQDLTSAKRRGVPDCKQQLETLNTLCNYLSVLHRSIRRPWRPYAECQETIKQILSFKGNITYEPKT